MNFWKISKGDWGDGGGRFWSKKFHCNFFALETALLVMNFRKNFEIVGGSFPIQKISLQIQCWSSWILEKIATFFPKKGGGGQRPFGTFPKIHWFWYRQASLTYTWLVRENLYPVVWAGKLKDQDKWWKLRLMKSSTKYSQIWSFKQEFEILMSSIQSLEMWSMG